MRILYVTPYVPSLIRVRPFNFIKQLAKRHEVTLISLVLDKREADAVEQIRGFCEKVYALPLSKTDSLISCCRRLMTPMPLQAAYTDLPTGRCFVSSVAGEYKFDALHVEHIRGAHLAHDVGHLPRVYDSVDCITRLLKQRLDRGCGAFQRILGYEELLKMRSYEPRVAATFDNIIVTSESDRRALVCLMRRFADHPREGGGSLNKLGHLQAQPIISFLRDGEHRASEGRASVVPNGVDCEYFRPMNREADQESIVFSGKMSYFANVDAVLRFYADVFPHVRQHRPGARFKIVGSDPPEAVRRLARDPWVEVTGYVPDIRPHLASASVIACPLTVGVGIQNKVLEAMAMGKAIVTSPIACSGIPGLVNGHHVVCADEPTEMAREIIDLLDHPERRLRIGESARVFVQERFSWEAATQHLEEAYVRAIEARRSRLLAAA